ncbi:MAG: hypothetical protein ABSC48_04820 [Terracidiphilus sp.]|jgi:hypothetical protein
MSIDGPGILESDLGNDVYNEILDLYDAGVPIEELRNRIAAYNEPSSTALDKEIYLAAAAKAYWEIGQLPEALQVELSQLIQSGKSFTEWAQCGDTALARSRKNTLNRLLHQISVPRPKPRPRKKYPKIQTKLYSVGDCLELTTHEKVYRAVVCSVLEYRGVCEYAILIMGPETLSNLESFKLGYYWGHLIGSTFDKRGYVFGPHVIRLEHRMLLRENNPFKTLGHVDLDETVYSMGSFGGVLNMQHVIEDFGRTETSTIRFGWELLAFRDLLKSPGS